MRGKKGVSLVTATVLLIALTIAAVGIVAIFITKIPSPTIGKTVTLSGENIVSGAVGFKITHTQGDHLPGCFAESEGKYTWNQLVVRIDGKPIGALGLTATIKVNDYDNISGKGPDDFAVGYVIKILDLSPALSVGQTLTVSYLPTGQTFLEIKVT